MPTLGHRISRYSPFNALPSHFGHCALRGTSQSGIAHDKMHGWMPGLMQPDSSSHVSYAMQVSVNLDWSFIAADECQNGALR